MAQDKTGFKFAPSGYRKGGKKMNIITGCIGICAVVLLVYYFVILMKGDEK